MTDFFMLPCDMSSTVFKIRLGDLEMPHRRRSLFQPGI